VFLIVFFVLAVVVMVNFLSRDYFLRLQVSTRTKLELSPLTVKTIQAITNQVKVILFYDKESEGLYSTVADLLNQYSLINPKISVQTIDYLRDPGLAVKVRADYDLAVPLDKGVRKNLVIFDAGGNKRMVVDGDALTRYVYEQVPNGSEREFRRRTMFEGETKFTAALLAVTTPKPLFAYVLQGHGGHSLESTGEFGYTKFAAALLQNSIVPLPLDLLGTNTMPTNCSLLVLPGPTKEIYDFELEKIDQYLTNGGRMLVLLNVVSLDRDTGRDKTGLDKLLAHWGVEVGHGLVQDPDNEVRGRDMIVREFDPKNPLVNPLLASGLYLISPRSVGQRKLPAQAADAPHVEELAFTGPRGQASDQPKPQSFPLMVAVEKGAIKNVITERGSTRIVVVGDSMFLENNHIESADNRAFVGYAVNWLLDRTQLLEALPSRPVKEYKLLMTRSQLRSAELILQAGMPGVALLMGGLVWLRRRK